MRTLFATQFASLDGFMDEPGRWTIPYWNDQIAAFKQPRAASRRGDDHRPHDVRRVRRRLAGRWRTTRAAAR